MFDPRVIFSIETRNVFSPKKRSSFKARLVLPNIEIPNFEMKEMFAEEWKVFASAHLIIRKVLLY